MTEREINERSALAIRLLEEFKQLDKSLVDSVSELEGSFGTVFENLYSSKKEEVKEKIDAYNNNGAIIRSLHFDMTARVNAWFEFSRNTRSLGSPLFPLQFYLEKKKLKKILAATGDKISRLVIENRFIREQLSIWERELSAQAIKLTENGENYSGYKEKVKSREEIIKDLKYLLPTIPGACPADISVASIEAYCKKLNNQ